MFMIGFNINIKSYFTSSTSIIAIPTGIKIINWYFSIWSSRIILYTPLYFIIGFIFSFFFGGITGLILSNCIIDTILHDSYYIVGHFHYVLSLGAIYTIFSSFYTYLSLLINNNIIYYYNYNEYIGNIHYILFFYSTNILFFTQHSLGILSIPRRIYYYSIIYYSIKWYSIISIINIYISILFFILSIL